MNITFPIQLLHCSHSYNNKYKEMKGILMIIKYFYDQKLLFHCGENTELYDEYLIVMY